MKTNNQTTFAVLAFALALAPPACSKGPLCQTLGTCGGDPHGTWVSQDKATDPPGCVDGPYFSPTNVTSPGAPLDQTLFGRPAPVAGQAQAQATLADWCQGLQLQNDPVQPLNGRTFLFQDPQITNLGIAYNADGTYQAGFKRSGRFGQYYSQTCLTQFGSNPSDCAGMQAKIMKDDVVSLNYNDIQCSQSGNSCACTWTDKAGQPQQQSGQAMYCTSVGVILNKEGTDETFSNVVCQANDSRGGCDCGFDVTFSSGETGFWSYEGNVITNYPEDTSINYSSQITFCVNGDSIDVSGLGSSYLFNKPPVRTFHLVRAATPTAPAAMSSDSGTD